jgi:hypothetical protein
MNIKKNDIFFIFFIYRANVHIKRYKAIFINEFY